jgi:hypothetical protein
MIYKFDFQSKMQFVVSERTERRNRARLQLFQGFSIPEGYNPRIDKRVYNREPHYACEDCLARLQYRDINHPYCLANFLKSFDQNSLLAHRTTDAGQSTSPNQTPTGIAKSL